MTKYYVYNVKSAQDGERSHAFVEDPILFALKAFDPTTMEFSGVFVEADSGMSAQRIYMHPKEDDVFVSCDEPKPTVLKRQAFESRARLTDNMNIQKIKQRISDAEYETRRLKTNTLSLEIAMHFNLLATQISEMARQILAMANEEDQKVFTHQIVYDKLLTQYAGQLLQLQYRPRPGGESQR